MNKPWMNKSYINFRCNHCQEIKIFNMYSLNYFGCKCGGWYEEYRLNGFTTKKISNPEELLNHDGKITISLSSFEMITLIASIGSTIRRGGRINNAMHKSGYLNQMHHLKKLYDYLKSNL